ncbi:MAG: trigger factor [Deltaproteobacteria bacterium]|nr:trigger factor [Deltaproteobacteria bacterium]
MQVSIEDVSPVEKKLAIEIPWERVREKLDAAYRDLGKGIQLRGFRKGKVPRSVLEQMFGKRVQLEVAKELVQESFVAAAQEHKLEPVAEPVVEDASIRLGETFRYQARIEVRGPVDLKEYEGLTLTRQPVKITDDEVARALEHKRLEHVEFKPIEGRNATADSDIVVASIKGKVGEHPVEWPQISVDLTQPHTEPLPGLSKALVGLPLDTKDHPLTLEIAGDAAQKEIAGKTATLTISIMEARQKVLPELDDDFAKDTGEADTLAELRENLRQGLEQAEKERADRGLREAALKQLVEKNTFPVAPALIERGMDSQLARFRMQLAMQGVDLTRSGVDPSELRQKFRVGAEDEVRGQLLLEAIGDKEGITVSDEEVDKRVAELAEIREKPMQKLRAEMEREGTLDSLRWRIRQEKALDLVVARATITEAEAQEKSP